MKKYLNYFVFFLKNIYKFNFEISKPVPKKYLLVDGEKNPLSDIIDKNNLNILYRRGEKLNLPIIIECIFEFKVTSLNYYLKYIKYSQPKVIFCFLDHINIFYLLGELSNTKTILFQYGTKSWDMGIFGNKILYNDKNYEKFFVDYIFVHNKGLANLYNKFVRGKKIVIGSFQGNFCNLEIKKKEEINFLSSYRANLNQAEWEEGDKVVIKYLYKLSQKTKIKFNISGRSLDDEIGEKKYYSSLLDGDYNFISKKENPDSSYVMERYKYTFSNFSTMIKENLARGNRCGFLLHKPNINQEHIFRFGYGKFEKLSDTGPFWANMKKFDAKEVEKVFNFVIHATEIEWKKIKQKFVDPVIEFDHNNKKFFDILKDIDK